MSRLRVAAIVEGQGELDCIGILLRRIWSDLVGGDYIDVKSVRQMRSRLYNGEIVNQDGIRRAVGLAYEKLQLMPFPDDPALVLILIDADDDKPCELGPKLLRAAQVSHSHIRVACVVANVEYETWFVAAAESLADFLELSAGFPGVSDPEGSRLKKGWVDERFRDGSYSETIHHVGSFRPYRLHDPLRILP